MKSKKKKDKKRNIDIEKLKPLIVVNEPGECLFAIVDFTLPGINHVRRIISKRIKSTGKIFAVMYEGEVGADNLCVSKKNVMELRDATPEKFWMTVKVIEALYKLKAGTVDIRLYDGKTMKEAADLMNRFNHAQIWEDEFPEK